MLGGGRNFGNGTDAGFLPLLWDSGGVYRQTKEICYWLAKGRSSQSEEPGWKSVKSGSCGMEAVKYLENSPVRDVFIMDGSSWLLTKWWCVAGVGRYGDIVAV